MDNLPFETAGAAFAYAQKFLGKSKLSVGSSFVGIIRGVDATETPVIYLIEIICQTGNFFNRKHTKIVSASKHPDLLLEIKENDLVVFGAENISMKIPTGYLLYKLNPVLDLGSKHFEICKNAKKFKVYIDDHFHYQNEDERYFHGEFESLEEAISACKNIVDNSLTSLLENCPISELKEKYYMFGEDPFIEGGHFSTSRYVEEKIQALLVSSKQPAIKIEPWQHEIDYKYGLLLPESEILEDVEFLYFCQTNRKKLCVSWNKKEKSWQVNIQRELLNGLSFSTPKRFEQIVFGEKTNQQGHRRKQYLVEYLLLGLDVGEVKTLTKELDDASKIEFSIESRTWNEMLIGNPVGLENGVCKYFKKNSKEEQVLPFALVCKDWDVNIEFILDDYENYEQYNFSIKDFGGYYE